MLARTVVMNCAGKGTRLGFGHPKCLIDVHGEPLIGRQLACLREVDDVRVVVGFQAQRVIDTVLRYRRDVVFVFNHDYAHTNALASLCMGARYGRPWILSLDGDLLVHPEDLARALATPGEWLALGEVITDEPVFVQTAERDGTSMVTAFSRSERTPFEWTGLTQVSAERLLGERDALSHVFHCLERYLPMPSIQIRSREVDTLDDYQALLDWSAPFYASTGATHS
jgi:choline kinase